MSAKDLPLSPCPPETGYVCWTDIYYKYGSFIAKPLFALHSAVPKIAKDKYADKVCAQKQLNQLFGLRICQISETVESQK